MIDIDAVTKRYGTATVLDAVSLRIPAGGVVSLIGANGAGKSTLLSIVGRLLEPDEGRVRVDDLEVATTSGTALARRLSVLRQDNHLPIRLSVRELVQFGRFPHSGGRLGPEDHERVEVALAHLELEPMAERRLDQLSGGQRQRAHIAMVLAQDTRYVLLDEPLNNLDMRHAAQTMDMIRRMADELDKTVVVVLHDINVAAHHSDRIVAMSGGRVVADGSPSEVVDRDVLHEVFGLDVPIAHTEIGPVAMHFSRARRLNGTGTIVGGGIPEAPGRDH